MREEYEVTGMTCGGCVRSVTRAIELAAPGVAVEVSLERGEASVEGTHDPAAVEHAIQAAGFACARRPRPPD